LAEGVSLLAVFGQQGTSLPAVFGQQGTSLLTDLSADPLTDVIFVVE